jgi:hypothetical protein
MYRSPKLEQLHLAEKDLTSEAVSKALELTTTATKTRNAEAAIRKEIGTSQKGSRALRASSPRELAEFEIPMNKSLSASLYFGLDSTVNLKSVELSLIGNLWTASLWKSDHNDFEFALVDLTSMPSVSLQWKSTTELSVEEIECTAITPSPTIVFLNPRYDTSDCSPSAAPTSYPSLQPIPAPTALPSSVPTTVEPTPTPTPEPSPVPTIPAPSEVPSPSPTKQPSPVMLPASVVLSGSDFFITNMFW